MKSMKNRGARWALAVIVLAGAWALGGGRKAELGLGSPASAVIAEFGHPDKISHASSANQTWFFLNDEGVLIPRVIINQGLVVEIRK